MANLSFPLRSVWNSARERQAFVFSAGTGFKRFKDKSFHLLGGS